MAAIRTWYLFALIVLVAVAGYADAIATIVGNVFCDQCRDGKRSIFDVPIYGAKVAVECRGGSDGQITMSMQESTDLIGDFIIKVDGTPDMSRCFARLIDSPPDSGCNIIGSPAQPLTLSFKLFTMEIYTVGSLFCQPAKPMPSICPNTAPPAITPPTPSLPHPAPPAITPPSLPHPDPPAITPPTPSLPHPAPPAITPPSLPHPAPPAITPPSLPHPDPPAITPPTPSLPHPAPPAPPHLPPAITPPHNPPTHPPPIISLPPLPFFKASACSHEYWVNAEYSCYWRFLSPHTKVSFVFGEEAAKRYGRKMSLWEGLQGRGDVYRVLLREATTSLLNSYNSITFRYNTLSVFLHMNSALQGSLQDALKQALYFKRANLGGGNTKCLLKPCK